jgi:hypothetical protein
MLLGEKRILFSKRQEAGRKDVEHAFGILLSRFAIIYCHGRVWHIGTLKNIINACIILHKMIIEDEHDTYANSDFLHDQTSINMLTIKISSGSHPSFASYLQRRCDICQRPIHHNSSGFSGKYLGTFQTSQQ